MKTIVVLTVFALVAAIVCTDLNNALGVPPQDNHNPEETASRVYQPPLTRDPRVRRDLTDLMSLPLSKVDDENDATGAAGAD